ncbi:T9SS type A sorting domain-containing protein [Gaoshiqia sp. Z1-71]|uniref:T9SS type A sorting domain-containing protein n=1 Tax=Gaoshiqia hydrogeniformans TaxID=3290090 RepID=UPI003BF78DB9
MRKLTTFIVTDKWPVFYLILLLMSGNAMGQISDGSLPASFRFSTKSAKAIPFSVLDSVRADFYLGEDVRLGIPNRYGIERELEIDIREQGVKTELQSVTVWQYEISCPDARSLSIFFKTFDLPEGAGVYLYNSDHSQLMGAFTNANHQDGHHLALAEFQGNSLVIEYNEPNNTAYTGGLVIGSVSTAYRDVQAALNSRIQINCPEGADWQTEKQSVCLMTFRDNGYSYYCSGALINNVRKDGTPYFLTANHCIATQSSANTLVTYFNYETSTCTGNDGSKFQTLSGSSLVSTNTASDFTLLRLSEYPPESYNPYLAGWNASGNIAASGTCIHHPQGSTKCIALDYSSPVSYNYSIRWDDNSISQPHTHWEVKYDAGVDEGGSSGAPLFDENKRIIGQLHGGDDNGSLFGKFSVSWNNSATASMQLKAWLDPDNTGTLQLDGWNYYSVPDAGFTADVSVACLNTPVYLTDLTKNNPTAWEWNIQPATFEFVEGTTKNSQHPVVSFTSEGSYSVSLLASNNNGSDIVSQDNLLQVYQTLPVAFSGLSGELFLCGHELKNYELVAEGASRFEFEVSAEDHFTVEVTDNILSLTLKDEVRPQGSFDTYVTVTGSHGTCSETASVLLHIHMPVNDDAAHAIALYPGRNSGFSNECGTVEDKEPAPETSGCLVENNWCPPASITALDNSVWFTFQGLSSGLVTIETEGFDSQIAVYEASSAADLLSGKNYNYLFMAASDHSLSGGPAAAIENLRVNPAKRYYLQVDGHNGDYGELVIKLLSNSIEVYPNPSRGLFHLTVASMEEGQAELAVYSFTGQQILSKTTSFTHESNRIDLDLSGHPAGMYFLRAHINGVFISKKLVLAGQ